MVQPDAWLGRVVTTATLDEMQILPSDWVTIQRTEDSIMFRDRRFTGAPLPELLWLTALLIGIGVIVFVPIGVRLIQWLQ